MLEALLTEDDRRFRDEVRAFIDANVPRDLRERVAAGADLGRDDYVSWQRMLAARGWLTTTWPVAEGGCDWSPVRHYLFEEELALADCPPVGLTLGVGAKLLGPILCEFGSAEQRARLLPPIRASAVWWCQGYSEPGAGSDLAALATRAELRGDEYVVSGTKIWTSYAHWADGMCCLVRTDPAARPQAGISFLLLDMHAPGVTVRPIAAINGRHFFNQVFLDEVRVPVAMRVGAENDGWRIAKSLLLHERLAAARVAETKKRLRLARSVAERIDFGGRRLADCDWYRMRLGALEIEARAIEQTALRYLGQTMAGTPPGPEIALLKVRGTELYQRIYDLLCDACGEVAIPLVPPDVDASAEMHAFNANRLYARGFTSAAGSSEVQRGILAKSLLSA
ncbi:MAG: acyl-CoA dehydrogenase family protein [Burkholderiales bacterium]|nr:acyl-CoA dehydrogenase family protein [Burkholderiales bacterium]